MQIYELAILKSYGQKVAFINSNLKCQIKKYIGFFITKSNLKITRILKINDNDNNNK